MYYRVGVLSTGFKVYRCVRGCSALEGMHLHYRQAQSAVAKASGLVSLHVRMNLFDFHWNVQAAARAGFIPEIGHSYVWLVDAIVDVLDKLDIDKCFPPNLRGLAADLDQREASHHLWRAMG